MQETQETWVRSLGWEDLLKKEMATHSSILAWWIPWTEEPSGLQFIGLQKVGHNWSDLACTCTYHMALSAMWQRGWRMASGSGPQGAAGSWELTVRGCLIWAEALPPRRAAGTVCRWCCLPFWTMSPIDSPLYSLFSSLENLTQQVVLISALKIRT